MTNFDCCYFSCAEPGTIHIGINGNPDSHWICWRHLTMWRETRARLLDDGGGCEMRKLGELLCDKCWNDGTNGDEVPLGRS